MLSNESKQLTKKQACWLKHLRESAAGGQALATYARSRGLRPQQLYAWSARLQAIGVWEPSEAVLKKRATTRPAQTPRDNRPAKLGFIAARLAPTELVPAPPGLRIRFPNGVVLEVGSSVQAPPDARLLSLLAALP
jgi:hypothetical protein